MSPFPIFSDPTIVAAGGPDLTPAQRAIATQRGLLIAEDMPNFHAELTALGTAAGDAQLWPTRGVTSNAMCQNGPNNCFDQLNAMARDAGYELRLSPNGRSFEFVRSGGQ